MKTDTKGGGLVSLQEAAKTLQIYGAAAAVLQLQDLQAYWLSIMTDPGTSAKDKLTASKLYGQSIGAFEKNKQNNGASGYRYSWKHTINMQPDEVKSMQ